MTKMTVRKNTSRPTHLPPSSLRLTTQPLFQRHHTNNTTSSNFLGWISACFMKATISRWMAAQCINMRKAIAMGDRRSWPSIRLALGNGIGMSTLFADSFKHRPQFAFQNRLHLAHSRLASMTDLVYRDTPAPVVTVRVRFVRDPRTIHTQKGNDESPSKKPNPRKTTQRMEIGAINCPLNYLCNNSCESVDLRIPALV